MLHLIHASRHLFSHTHCCVHLCACNNLAAGVISETRDDATVETGTAPVPDVILDQLEEDVLGNQLLRGVSSRVADTRARDERARWAQEERDALVWVVCTRSKLAVGCWELCAPTRESKVCSTVAHFSQIKITFKVYLLCFEHDKQKGAVEHVQLPSITASLWFVHPSFDHRDHCSECLFSQWSANLVSRCFCFVMYNKYISRFKYSFNCFQYQGVLNLSSFFCFVLNGSWTSWCATLSWILRLSWVYFSWVPIFCFVWSGLLISDWNKSPARWCA